MKRLPGRFDPLPAGSYSGNGPNAITVDNKGGRNGAFGPGYMQLDTRVGWRFRVGQAKTLDLTADVINLTNRANFVNPTSDRRSTNFLLLTTLYGGGQPRKSSAAAASSPSSVACRPLPLRRAALVAGFFACLLASRSFLHPHPIFSPRTRPPPFWCAKCWGP